MWNYQNNGKDDSSSTGQYYVGSNVDTNYDGYQQAWRIMGIYVDCSTYISALVSSNNNNNDNHNNDKNHGCQRYLVWASYVDLQYQGGGIGEYQYYNPTTKMYDDATCIATNNERCARMDCHEATSDTWSLMGLYKEPYYASEYFEQLFKHLAYCVWDSDTYSFMKDRYDIWPDEKGCVASSTYNPTTNLPYYIDLKPGPNMTLALYTDPVCFHEHAASDDVNVDQILQSAGYLSADYAQQFNDALMPFHYCQPCIAYTLGNSNDGYSCSDAAGYDNVNQCMKFHTKTTMMPLTHKDIHVATLQGTLTQVQFYVDSTNANRTAQQLQQQQQSHSLSSSYQSIYFQPSLNSDIGDTARISSAGAYVVLSLAILCTIGTIYYCYHVTRWVIGKNSTTPNRNSTDINHKILDRGAEEDALSTPTTAAKFWSTAKMMLNRRVAPTN